jgi:hypothetical protein
MLRFLVIMVLFRRKRIVQIALQDKRSCRGIVSGVPVGLPDFLDNTFGQNRGESFVSELYRKVGMAAELRNKVAHLSGLSAQAAVHGKRQADDNPLDVVFTGDIDNRLDICRAVLPRDNGQRAG